MQLDTPTNTQVSYFTEYAEIMDIVLDSASGAYYLVFINALVFSNYPLIAGSNIRINLALI